MSLMNGVQVDAILSRGSIKDADVLGMRRSFYDDGIISPAEAATLFELNDKCRIKDPAWTDFFIEALTDYVVNQEHPEGYLTVANAEWLIERVSHDDVIETATELELLINVIDRARWTPASLVSFALKQVKHAVLTGSGPLRSGKQLAAGKIDAAEIELLRKMIYAFGGDAAIAVSRAEAEVLFDINDAIVEVEAPAEWTDLFSKAIASTIMAASGYKVAPREEALRREEWLQSRGELSLSSFVNRVVTSGLGGIWGAYTEQSSEERALARLEQQKIEIVTNEKITEGEAAWLAERIGRDGKMHENEKALLLFIKRESPDIHPALAPLIDRVAAVAA